MSQNRGTQESGWGSHVALAATALLVCTCLPALAGTSDALLQGASRLQAGDLVGAASAFERAASEDRLCAEAVAGSGAAALFSGDADGALRHFRNALVLAPGLACAHMGAGSASCLLSDYQSAMSFFRSALNSAPRTPALALSGEAYAACALGLYDTAIQQARSALGTVPDNPTARHALAAALLARGDPSVAAGMYSEPLVSGSLRSYSSPLFLPSCLWTPRAAYWAAHSAADESQLSRALARIPVSVPASGPSGAPAPVGDFSFDAPRPGDVLRDRVTVSVRVDNGLDIDHVIVRIDDSYAGITSARPFKVVVDTRLLDDGACEIRADGFDTLGRLVRTTSLRVKVQNGNRTLGPEERDVRQAVAELLEQMLAPPVSPFATRQLIGHGLMATGQPQLAAGCFESAYAGNARIPGLRTDLLLAYSAMGLELAAAAPEVATTPANSKQVAVTFDDGPHPLITPWILDELDKWGVKATFFLVGKQVTLYPELVREIRRRGHTVGSHSHAHYSLRHMSLSECEQDLVKSRLALREASGETVKLFRPPGGYYDDTVRQAAGNLGFTTIFWTANITSFPGRDGQRIAAELARQCANGGIILLHNGEDETLDTLPHLIPALRKYGVKFVTFDNGNPNAYARLDKPEHGRGQAIP